MRNKAVTHLRSRRLSTADGRRLGPPSANGADALPQQSRKARVVQDGPSGNSALRHGRKGTVADRAPVPATNDWRKIRRAAETCRACPLWKNATCTVFGEGPRHARVIVVGEQPGDQEDRVGKPFVGPAGKLLDRALAAAGVDRNEVYVTNAVKHFKWSPKGKRRLHEKPNAREIAACRPWLEKEIDLLRPALIVCLGATAAYSVAGAGIKVTMSRGEIRSTDFAVPALITLHPSALLREPDRVKAAAAFDAFASDLKKIRRCISR